MNRPNIPTDRPPRAVLPALDLPATLLLQAQDIRLAIFDVDGVLTDGGQYFGEPGELLKRFHVQDGHGLKLLERAGIAPAIISGRDSPALRRRVDELGIMHARFGVGHKRVAAEALMAELALDWPAVAAIGDDWPDLPLLQQVGFAAAPADAHPQVRALVDHVTTAAGGRGAAREFADLLLVAGGHYARLLQQELAAGADAA